MQQRSLSRRFTINELVWVLVRGFVASVSSSGTFAPGLDDPHTPPSAVDLLPKRDHLATAANRIYARLRLALTRPQPRRPGDQQATARLVSPLANPSLLRRASCPFDHGWLDSGLLDPIGFPRSMEIERADPSLA